ncbi:phosphotransferase [Dinoroseobacter sp. S124A]|uniref:phosphotransferase n=1 Tax=Dinoroseobacter sp. S124A TaxID=3415128 RepID=UPI003C7E5B98
MTRDDRMMASALGSWQQLAPFAGLDPASFSGEELWRREDPGRVRIVMRMTGPDGRNLVFKRIFAPVDQARWAEGLAGQRRAVRALRADKVHAPAAILAEDASSLSTIQDYVVGRTLQDHLLLKYDKPDQRGALLTRAGAALRAYYDSTAAGEKRFNPARMVDYMERLARKALDGQLAIVDPDLFAVLVESLKAAAAAAEGAPVMLAAQHGDLHARNMILSANRATLIDFMHDKEAPAVYDLARLLVDLGARFAGTRALDPRCGLPPEDLAALSEGYGADLGADPCMAFLCRCRVLQDWAALPSVGGQRSAFQQERLVQLQRAATILAEV